MQQESSKRCGLYDTIFLHFIVRIRVTKTHFVALILTWYEQDSVDLFLYSRPADNLKLKGVGVTLLMLS